MKFLKSLKPYEWAILLGVFLRTILLLVSVNNRGYWGGDTKIYGDMARLIMNGDFVWSQAWYPIGYPVFLNLFTGISSSLWIASVGQVVIFAFFSFWFCSRINSIAGKKWALFTALFLAIDPLWIVYTNIITPDTLGAMLFGGVFLEIWQLPKNPKLNHLGVLAFLLSVSAFLKPVYLFAGPLAVPLFWMKIRPKDRVKLTGLFLIIFAIPIFTNVIFRTAYTGKVSFSGHNPGHFAGYTLGMMYMATGRAHNLDDAFDKMNQDEAKLLKSRPEITEAIMAKEIIQKHPIKFFRILLMSLYKTVFGHANSEMIHFFKAKYVEGPGLFINLNFKQGLWKQLKNTDWGWYFGVFFQLVIRLILVILAGLGIWQLYKKKDYFTAAGFFIIIGYYAATPIVFGAPRYFIPGTMILLLAATQSKYRFKRFF